MYKACLFSLDGDWTTDYRRCKTKQEVWDRINDQGSKWFFYPISFVIVDHSGYITVTQRVVDTPDELKELQGRTIDQVSDWIGSHDLSWLVG